jgi:hypothetical protein
MNKMHILGLMKRLGYEPFKPTGSYFQSTMRYIIASFQNKESDPLIYEVSNNKNQTIKIWNVAQKLNTPFTYKWPEDEIIFDNNLFINADRFVVNMTSENVNKIFQYQISNRFNRQVIRGTDDRLDLGLLNFIVSDAGILYSNYEHSGKKILMEEDTFGLITDFRETANNISISVENKLVGQYSTPFEIQAIHLLPKGNVWSPRIYEDWS